MAKNNLEQAYKELFEAYKLLKEELGLLNGKKQEQNLKEDTMILKVRMRSNFYDYFLKNKRELI